MLLADITAQQEDNYCGRTVSPGLNDSPAHESAINPRGTGGLRNTLFPPSSLALMLAMQQRGSPLLWVSQKIL